MKLTCQNCQYEWDYGGKSEWYASCPRCHYKVRIPKKTEANEHADKEAGD